MNKILKRITYLLSDKVYLNIIYYKFFHKRLNLKNPKTFNEKLQWLKLYDRKAEYTKMVDKYEVRSYVKEKLGNEVLIPLLGVWNSFDEIDFNLLPNEFVLKCTHDSGGIKICTNKKDFKLKEAKLFFDRKLKNNFYYYGREWPYKNVRPKIIAEKLMKDSTSDDIKDYKFMCFNGKVKCSFVCTDRFKKNDLKVTFFDKDWNVLPFERHYPKSQEAISKPKNYDKMVNYSEILAENTTFVRIDFYEINGDVYFGEITFYPGSGFEEFKPEEWDEILGTWIDLNDKL